MRGRELLPAHRVLHSPRDVWLLPVRDVWLLPQGHHLRPHPVRHHWRQASQTQQPVAEHRDTGDAPRIRPSLPGRLEAASFSLHNVNFGFPWSSSAASSTSCSSENDAEASSPLDLQPRTTVLLQWGHLPRRGAPRHRQGVERTCRPSWTAGTTDVPITWRNRRPTWILPTPPAPRAA